MFRANRIGTPYIHQSNFTISAAAWTPNSQSYTVAGAYGNVINAVAAGEFYQDNLSWTGGPIALTASHKVLLCQQFTVQKPIAGNAVGLELIADIMIRTNNAYAFLIPTLVKLESPAVAVLGAVNSIDMPTQIAVAESLAKIDNTIGWHNMQYKTQAVLRDGTPAGVYGHGFQLYDAGGAGLSMSHIKMSASVRQLQFQAGVGYQDTRRN